MDAKAYLISQGWSGPGNPLNPSRRVGGPHAGLGLTKPILVARKKNTHGIGNKTTHDHTNQWWLRGFEEALKGVGEDGSSTPTTATSEDNGTGLRSELYKFFVRGQGLKGTIGTRIDKEVLASFEIHGTKRKRDAVVEIKNDVPEKQRKKSKREECETTEDLDFRQNARKSKKEEKSKRKTKENSISIKSARSLEVSEDMISPEKPDLKKGNKEKRHRKNPPIMEVQSISYGGDAIDLIGESHISEKEARRKRKELKKAKRLAKQEKRNKGQESDSRRSGLMKKMGSDASG